MPSGAVRIVEAFSGATIEWSRTKNHKDWVGQFLYANSLAVPGGVVRAFADPAGGTWSAWTELFPDFGESQLVLTQNLDRPAHDRSRDHAFLVALARGRRQAPRSPATTTSISRAHGRSTPGSCSTPTATRSSSTAISRATRVDAAGARHYLLLDAAGVEWYRSPTPPGRARPALRSRERRGLHALRHASRA